MERASRIVSILLGLGVTFLLWPVAVPLGFGEVWWASQKAQGQSDTKPVPVAAPSQPVAPSPTPPPQAAAPLPAPAPVPAPAPHAVEQDAATPEPAQPPQAAAKTGQTAAATAKDPDKTGAVAPQTTPKLYYRVTVRDGGTLQSGSVVIKLAGIAARDDEATCKGTNGKAWPCGAAAKAALTRLIHARAVTCEVPKQGTAKDIVAHCSVAETDLSTWMVRQGWAEPKDANEPALVQAAAAAKQNKLGLWRGAE
jgi:endonuclease YncB( thermonuclease family)